MNIQKMWFFIIRASIVGRDEGEKSQVNGIGQIFNKIIEDNLPKLRILAYRYQIKPEKEILQDIYLKLYVYIKKDY